MAELEMQRKRNPEFTVLSALAMAFTVMGHAGVVFGTLDWLFPYDSFHMPMFVFISGYFFNPLKVSIGNTKNYFAKQLRRLVIPFFIWNLVYGLIALLFNSRFGIEWCHANEFWSRFLIRPFTIGNSFFEFNAPSWFILMLFEVKALNWLFRLPLRKLRHREPVITLFYLLLACAAVLCSQRLPRTDLLIAATRTFYMLFWLQAGTVYKLFLEKRDTLPSAAYFGIVLTIQAILWLLCRTKGMIAGVWNSEFANGPILTILAAGTGIAFFLRISKILARSIGNHRLVVYISTHTFSIMMHHIMGFTLLNLLLRKIDSVVGWNIFDLQAFRTNLWYRYFPQELSNLNFLYVVVGFLLPLGCCMLWEFLRSKRASRGNSLSRGK